MKKNVLISICLFGFVVGGKGQQLMTNAEIYDYNIGDVFVMRCGGFYSPCTWVKTTIANRYYNVAGDTLFYVYNGNTYTPCFPNCAGTLTSTTGSIMSITHLNDTMGMGLGTKPYNYFCIDTAGYTGTWMDTTWYNSNYCGKETTTIKYLQNGPQLMDSCYSYFEPFWGYNAYGRGLGHVEYYFNSCANGPGYCESGSYMVYYKKGNDSCGYMPQMYDNLGVGISTIINQQSSINIYPNPATNQLNITIKDNTFQSATITITNIIGEIVHQSTINNHQSTINITALPKGMYLVETLVYFDKLNMTDGKRSVMKFVKE